MMPKDSYNPIPCNLDDLISIPEDPVLQESFKAIEDEFSLLEELLRTRIDSGLTQAEVAKRMGVKQPAVARLESHRINKKKHSPRLDTLRSYADALNCRLEIRMVPR